MKMNLTGSNSGVSKNNRFYCEECFLFLQNTRSIAQPSLKEKREQASVFIARELASEEQ
jgi:hypothetical protein